jgi:hypothetical protein
MRTMADVVKENAELRTQREALAEALSGALATIEDYLGYSLDGDPWKEDARLLGEMDINDYGKDGRIVRARAALKAVR